MRLQHPSRRIAIAGHAGDPQVVIDALSSGDPTIRRTALGAAARLEILDDDLVRAALSDPSAPVRRRALELTPRSDRSPSAGSAEPGHQLIAAVIDLLHDDECAEPAAFVLGELGVASDQVVRALEAQATTHDDSPCRESAVAALGALGAGRQTVLAATSDVATVRRRAVIALANFEGPEVEAALTAALDDRDWQVRQAAEDLQDPGGETAE